MDIDLYRGFGSFITLVGKLIFSQENDSLALIYPCQSPFLKNFGKDEQNGRKM